ncbi:MAG: nucleoside hydrolase [Verrucomicrobiales bacterium]|jgi:hypothetical protein|nr:nucleoside hydrolase [Verrucomicrobiales bacterium]
MTNCNAVLDTDTYNEVDDQFALAHLLLSPDRVNLRAVYAAPFHNRRSSGPADGMEKSHDEILRVLDLVRPAVRPPVLRGAPKFLPAAGDAVPSAAVSDLIDRARATPDGQRLQVVAIAAITNIASALLLAPDIAAKIHLTWLGGHAPWWPDTDEFNLAQDCHAARAVLDSAAPLTLIPCLPVASHLSTTPAELRALLAPTGRLGAYLTDIVSDYLDAKPAGSKIIWDLAASARLIIPAALKTVPAPAPVLRDNLTWQSPPPAGRRAIDLAISVDRDAVFADFFRKTATIK